MRSGALRQHDVGGRQWVPSKISHFSHFGLRESAKKTFANKNRNVSFWGRQNHNILFIVLPENGSSDQTRLNDLTKSENSFNTLQRLCNLVSLSKYCHTANSVCDTN